MYLSHLGMVSHNLAIASQRVLLNLSTNPLVCGWYGEERWCLILNWLVRFCTSSFRKWDPWSDCRMVGVPNLHIIPSYMNFATETASARLRGLASGHLVK